ncbi:hypothetical protein [Algoriphagus boritolerans]|uniref:DUF5689 domain-containing protein n=2 Tax=Algoriphagus TaxID=246875 RepID=A0A1H6AJ22_9BACT|nr:hypothetical protein [Algoriphagus boritolerans]SEG48392.1 hypothetical protein SAMN03080598_04155 [Algoriphagus boritolerans DSM 17298 = JCM 18970]
MKKLFNTPAFAMLGLFSVILFSCTDKTDPIVPEPNLGAVEDEFVINAAFEDLDYLTLDALQSSGLGARIQAASDLCANASVNHDQPSKKIIVDFGAGCTSPNGVVRKGKILLSYTGSNFLFPGTSIVTTFEGYEVNGLKIQGTRTITNGGIDLLNSKVTLNVKIENGLITWPDNQTVTYSSTQVRQVSLGSSGYEVSVTGTASGKSREGFDYTATVLEPLIINEDCARTGVYIPSLGVLGFSFQNISVSVNYGFGTCDKVVEITYPGGAKEVTLD